MEQPLKTTISPEHPLLVLMWMPYSDPTEEARQLVRLWEGLDDVIRPHVSVQIGRHHPERNRVLLTRAQAAGVPITLQIQGDNGDRTDTIPMEEIRALVDSFPCIVGLEIGEASQRTFTDHGSGPEYSMGRNARYARDAIRIAGEYGLYFTWQLQRDSFLAIGCSADNEALFDAICEHRDNVIPMHEMNGEFAKHANHTGAMGLWASGATNAWGVEAQSWYWHDAGYNAPGTYFPGTIEMPGALYAIMFLLGASAGATAYAIEPPRDVWPGGEGAWRFEEWVAPVFRRLVLERLIPTREEVIAATPAAYHLPRCRRHRDYRQVLDDMSFDLGEGRLARAAYGVFDRARESEMIPNNPRYGWIPALPAKTPQEVLDRFPFVLRPGDVRSTEDAREKLDSVYPPAERGTAWSTVVGPLTLAMNTHENWFVGETARLKVPPAPAHVQIVREAGEVVFRWTPNSGDSGYRVWRLRGGVEECVASASAGVTAVILRDAAEGDRYAVSAATPMTEEIEFALHLHDFLVFSNSESRCSAWVGMDNSTVERPRIGETPPRAHPDAEEKERLCAACSPIEDLASPVIAPDDPFREAKQAVSDAILGWKQALEREDVDAVLAFYDPDYREEDGRTVESVGVALRSIFWRYLEESAGSVAAEWGSIYAWSHPAVRIVTRNWHVVSPNVIEVDTKTMMWAGSGPEMEPSDIIRVPWDSPCDLKMTWRRRPEGWRILKTTPAFVRMESTVPFRWCFQGW